MAEGAKASIRRLRNGIVPADSMESLSIGYSRLRDLVLARAVQLGRECRVAPLLVRGEWGSGKSHFVRFVRVIAQHLGLASALVNLNARSHALNYPQRFYPALADSCQAARGRVGLRQIITPYLTSDDGRALLKRFSATHSGDISRAIAWLCSEYEAEDDPLGLLTGEHPAWTTLLGEDLAWAPYGYKRMQAMRRIADLAKLFKSLGSSGLILIFDEVETIDQLWNIRSRLSAYATLGELASIDYVWCVLAVTARFYATVERDMSRGILSDRELSMGARRFLNSLHGGHMDTVTPPMIDKKGASELATRILELYRQAHAPHISDGAMLSSVVDAWSRDPRSNPRTLIRAIVDQLDRLHPVTGLP